MAAVLINGNKKESDEIFPISRAVTARQNFSMGPYRKICKYLHLRNYWTDWTPILYIKWFFTKFVFYVDRKYKMTAIAGQKLNIGPYEKICKYLHLWDIWTDWIHTYYTWWIIEWSFAKYVVFFLCYLKCKMTANADYLFSIQPLWEMLLVPSSQETTKLRGPNLYRIIIRSFYRKFLFFMLITKTRWPPSFDIF